MYVLTACKCFCQNYVFFCREFKFRPQARLCDELRPRFRQVQSSECRMKVVYWEYALIRIIDSLPRKMRLSLHSILGAYRRQAETVPEQRK